MSNGSAERCFSGDPYLDDPTNYYVNEGGQTFARGPHGEEIALTIGDHDRLSAIRAGLLPTYAEQQAEWILRHGGSALHEAGDTPI